MPRKIPRRPGHGSSSGGAPEPPDHGGNESKTLSFSDGGQEPGSVGYCRPPLHSRFKPGQSGNPKGRPKQSRNLLTILKQVLNEQMSIRVSGRLRRMSAAEALVRTLLMRAFKGDAKAMNSLLVLHRQSSYGADQEEGAADLLLAPLYQAIAEGFLHRNVADNTANTSGNEAKGGSRPGENPKNPKA